MLLKSDWAHRAGTDPAHRVNLAWAPTAGSPCPRLDTSTVVACALDQPQGQWQCLLQWPYIQQPLVSWIGPECRRSLCPRLAQSATSSMCLGPDLSAMAAWHHQQHEPQTGPKCSGSVCPSPAQNAAGSVQPGLALCTACNMYQCSPMLSMQHAGPVWHMMHVVHRSNLRPTSSTEGWMIGLYKLYPGCRPDI